MGSSRNGIIAAAAFIFVGLYFLISLALVLFIPEGAPLFFGAAGKPLAAAFSFAALYIPVYLLFCGVLVLSPLSSRRWIPVLSMTTIPFLSLSLFFRIASETGYTTVMTRMVTAFGKRGSLFLLGLLTLLFIFLSAVVGLGVKRRGPVSRERTAGAEGPRGVGVRTGSVSAAAPAASSVEAGIPLRQDPETLAGESQFVFTLPEIPEPPALTSIREPLSEAALSDLSTPTVLRMGYQAESDEQTAPDDPSAMEESDASAAADEGIEDVVELGIAPEEEAFEAALLEEYGKEAEEGEEREDLEDDEEEYEEEPDEGEDLGDLTYDGVEGPAIPGTEQVITGAGTSEGRRKGPRKYTVPVETLLNEYPDGQYWVVDDDTRHAADILKETLEEFRIQAEVTGIRKGPVITMFEILPAPGVKLSKIVNLADNIALRLAASRVRIVAPIPGKHAVGIEVPNKHRAIVSFRELFDSDIFNTGKMEIPVILGKDITGEAQVIDLVQTPHLLIAGATGSGKSVCVNSIICTILYKRKPEEVRMILIDPKIVELKLYNDIPHLLTSVVTEPKRAFQALQYCICEMERRYSLLDGVGVRDIKSYNRRVKEREFAAEAMPYIVVVIDEFADLMATTGKELESTLARLAAMSRAVGIHLVLATQRPSIDVITGLIKANIPSRVAFMVASKFDSRIIIDAVGAEKLLGKGDMLVSTAQDAFPVRMQGAFVSEEEVERVVGHVKTLGQPDYIDDEIFFDEDEEDGSPSLFDDEGDDPLFEKALEIVLQQGKASASYLQRRLKIGYNRAARLVEMMEEKGIVGPSQGSKPRDVMRNPEVAGRPDAGRTLRAGAGPDLGFGDEGPDGSGGSDGDPDGEG